MFPFAGAAIGAGFVAVIASLVWPFISSQPRPEPLSSVRDVVLGTPQGQKLAHVLGVTDEANAQPVDPAGFAVGVATNMANNITASVQKAVAGRVLESLANQFHQLPADEQETFRTRVCHPSDANENVEEP